MKFSFFGALVFFILAFMSIKYHVDCFHWSEQAKKAGNVRRIYAQYAKQCEANRGLEKVDETQASAVKALNHWLDTLTEENKQELSKNNGRMMPDHYIAALDLCYLIITAP